MAPHGGRGSLYPTDPDDYIGRGDPRHPSGSTRNYDPSSDDDDQFDNQSNHPTRARDQSQIRTISPAALAPPYDGSVVPLTQAYSYEAGGGSGSRRRPSFQVRRPSNVADQPRRSSYVSENRPLVVDIAPNNPGIAARPSDAPDTRSNDLSQEFIEIEYDDFSRCALYVWTNPSVLRENTDGLQRQAIQAIRDGNTNLAGRIIQRIVLIMASQTIPERVAFSQYVQSLEQRGSAHRDFKNKQDRIYAGLVAHIENQHSTSQRARRQSLQHPPARNPTVSRPHYPEAPIHENMSRLSVADPNPIRDPEASTAGIRLARNARTNAPTSEGHRIQVRANNSNASSLSSDYKVRRPPEAFFTFGKVFKVLWHQPAGRNIDGQLNAGSSATTGMYGEPIHSGLRWMMVVMPKSGYCICCPISTYGGKGLSNKNMAASEIDAHAIVHASSIRPALLQSEVHIRDNMTKDPIPIELVRDSIPVDRASRIHFGKFHTVEYNVKVMEIGKIPSTSRQRVIGYVSSCMQNHLLA